MITIDEKVLAYDDVRRLSYEHFVVTSPRPVEEVVAALVAVEPRLMGVGADGVEYGEDDEPWAQDVYTPNYVSPPTVEDEGVSVYVDCKGAIDPPMTPTFHRVLREVLGAALGDAHVAAVIYED